jgi:hypothetical protein
MSRKQQSLHRSLIVFAALALSAGSAFADDSSMSMWTGDSYAYFNNLDNNPGKFNTARAPRTDDQNVIVRSPAKDTKKAEQRVMLATRPSKATRTNPFRDDTGA